MMVRIDKARLEDIGRLAELLDLLFMQESDFRPEREKQERGLRMIIESPSVGQIFVARDEEEKQVVGMVSLLFTVSTAEGGMVCLLEDMVVASELHGKGLGSRLVQNALEFARVEGFLRVTLLTDWMNEGALRFYQRLGFIESKRRVLKVLL